MQNVSTYYRAEVDYRREQVAREFRQGRALRAARAFARKNTTTRTDAA
jgi:hypothetical protein